MNEARAMRIAEVLNDFHVIQRRISQFRANSPPEDYQEPGYVVLRQCTAEGLAVLSAQFETEPSHTSRASEEQKKQQFQRCVRASVFLYQAANQENRILLDASARRFQAQKIYLRAAAASRWINTRHTILQGQRPQAIHTSALQQANNVLRAVSRAMVGVVLD